MLRQDNALKRLGPLASELGMLLPDEERELERRLAAERDLVELARRTPVSVAQVNGYLESIGERAIREPQRVAELARRPKVSLRTLLDAAQCSPRELCDDVWRSAEIEIKYAGYLEREREAAGRLAELAGFELPADLPYGTLMSLSTEARQKLERVRPESLARAARIPGVSQSDLQNLVLEVVKLRRAVA